jgi:hypothetical protein
VNGANIDFFFSLCLYALKFDMVIVYACIDIMGGFRDSNTIHVNNSIIKQQNYNRNVKEMKLSITVFFIIVIIVLQ